MSERGVTQPGRVPVLGTGRRMFESCRPDPENIQKAASLLVRLSCFMYLLCNYSSLALRQNKCRNRLRTLRVNNIRL